MRKWILTKELFDSDILKSQNEIPYLQGNLPNSYEPLGEEKMNLNHLLMMCPYFMICFGNNMNGNHYVTYEDGIYLFVFINDRYRCHIAFDLKVKNSIGVAFIAYELPIEVEHIRDSIISSHLVEGSTIEEISEFLMTVGIEYFKELGFTEIIDFNQETYLSRMN